jgi:hypothetical protein
MTYVSHALADLDIYSQYFLMFSTCIYPGVLNQ